jgi:hypothetical protein
MADAELQRFDSRPSNAAVLAIAQEVRLQSQQSRWEAAWLRKHAQRARERAATSRTAARIDLLPLLSACASMRLSIR